MNEVIHHPAFKLYPLAADLIFDGFSHGLVVTIIEVKRLFPTRSEFHNDVFCLISNFRRVGDDVDMNIS